MEINSQTEPFDERAEVLLSEDACNHSGQDVACTTGCHARIARWVDVNGYIGCGDNCPVAFENHVSVPRFGKLLGHLNAVGGYIFGTFSDKARHFTRMRSQHSTAEVAFEAD